MRTLFNPWTPNDRPPWRTALIAKELGLSETKQADEDALTEVGEGCNCFWRGLTSQKQRIHGVGFAVKSSLLYNFTKNPIGISERLMT